jgi:hypothetical protein
VFSKTDAVLQGTIELDRLTKAGEREFEEQASGWLRLSHAVSRAVTSTDLPVTGPHR